MDLENSFVVPADIETAWQTLLDVEAVAPCMPGATLTSFDGDNFTAAVKVKLGPVTMTYNGEGSFVSKDESAHRAVIEGVGKETRGTGTAKALVTTVLIAETPERTRVEVVTELTITGKAAQFGKGVMTDVSKRLIDQFSANLEQVILARQGAANAEAAIAAGEVPPTAPAPAPVQAADSIDLLGTAGAPVAKRLIPVVIGVVLVVGIIWWLVKKKR